MAIDRTLLILNEIRDVLRLYSYEFRSINSRLTMEFSEIHDRLSRLKERIDGFIMRIEKIEDDVK
jgi:hypothetical protein